MEQKSVVIVVMCVQLYRTQRADSLQELTNVTLKSILYFLTHAMGIDFILCYYDI